MKIIMLNKEIKINLENKIEHYINDLVKDNKFSGSVLISVNGDKLLSRGYNKSNYELLTDNTKDTKYRIGSLTKQFTAAAILQLEKKGLLSIDDKLNKYISDYPKGDEISIHNLLTHTSGIFNYTDDETFDSMMRKSHTIYELIDEFKYKKLNFTPGEKYSYSNSGYILLGYIIEKVSGISYKDYVEKNIFNFLNMHDSGYSTDNKLLLNKASGYDYHEAGLENCTFIDMSVPHAAGALHSTVEDLFLWNNYLLKLNKDNTDSLNKLFNRYVKTEEGDFYGYGLVIKDLKLKNKPFTSISHYGGIDGFLSFSGIYPEYNLQIVVLNNLISPFFQEIVENICSITLDFL
ncbi:serine hydrolase domain-containing protein [Oceanirhabdus sp. W0125-5]|uniref:serine hydrolase domain-containing protein n=1 Tax=Oceanirhabdus sp. W0125-5 TaxID=2999116 RepID=UPI0022F32124|nr:serine hydrolase domain-containing protein [Oceanirhabdus sp. W0125-5]WBW94700.1 serine hydrolase [Oceanirhabdus sp. W0125-5]